MNPVYHIPPAPAKTYFPCFINAIGGCKAVAGVSTLLKTTFGAEDGNEGRRLFSVGFDILAWGVEPETG